MYNKIIESLIKHQDGIMCFTLGSDIDECGEKYVEVYRFEWANHSSIIARAIENIELSEMKLNPDMIVGIIVNEWFGTVGCDVEELNYYGLIGVAISIMKDIEE